MDPGTGLGAVSLALQLFGGCIKGMVLLSEARNVGKVGSSLLCLLSIQELRLIEWAKRAGLLGPQCVLDRRINAVAVESMLSHLCDILGDVEKLSKRYKMRLTEVRPKDAGEAEGDGDQNVLSIAISQETRRDIMWRSRQIQDRNILPKRLWFAAFDRDKFKEMVADVRMYVQELWNLLDPLTQDDMLRQQQLVLSRVITLTEKVNDLKALREALDSTTSQTGTDSGLMPLANIAAVKAALLEIDSVPAESVDIADENRMADDQQPLKDIPHTQVVDFKPLNALGDVGLATYGSRTCFVERRDISSENRWTLLKRVQQLAQVLHVPKDSRFCSLHCIGLYIDDGASHVTFVFQLPTTYAQHTISLRDMLSGGKGPRAPSISFRIELAVQLLQSIHYFHTVGWMHKNLRSENVRFFADDLSSFVESAESALAGPMITGFAFARLDATGEVTEKPSVEPARDIYRHPSALSAGATSYQPFMDLYSLGVVLLEIAEWRPLSTLLKSIVDVKRAAVVPLAQLMEVSPWLYEVACGRDSAVKVDFRMGGRYARAVRLCLGAERLDGEMEGGGLTARTQKGEAIQVLGVVIEELKGCVI